MAEMNKRPRTARSELEDELIGNITDQQALMETGRDDKKDTTFKKKVNKQMRQFHIRQGHRMRHPHRVLHEHPGIVSTTLSAETAWEKALLHDDKRTELPGEYRTNIQPMVTNQVGVVQHALQNFKKSKMKFRTPSTLPLGV
jgi:hypothetical protein